jgi:hypothetical protein
LLAFYGGEWYVGQAADVTRRYLEHRRFHADIARVFFKPFPRDQLSAEELRLIGLLETTWGWPLRNLALASIPKGVSALRELVEADRLEAWMLRHGEPLPLGRRRGLDDLRRKTCRRVTTLQALPTWKAVEGVLAAYLAKALPAAWSTELDFWSLSCLPGGPRETLLVRLNIGWQEVLAISGAHRGIRVSFYVADSRLPPRPFRRALFWLRHPGALRTSHRYKPGGADQLHVMAMGALAAEALMQNGTFLEAVRHFNGRLMQKGPVNPGFATSHCAGLVDVLQERVEALHR